MESRPASLRDGCTRKECILAFPGESLVSLDQKNLVMVESTVESHLFAGFAVGAK